MSSNSNKEENQTNQGHPPPPPPPIPSNTDLVPPPPPPVLNQPSTTTLSQSPAKAIVPPPLPDIINDPKNLQEKQIPPPPPPPIHNVSANPINPPPVPILNNQQNQIPPPLPVVSNANNNFQNNSTQMPVSKLPPGLSNNIRPTGIPAAFPRPPLRGGFGMNNNNSNQFYPQQQIRPPFPMHMQQQLPGMNLLGQQQPHQQGGGGGRGSFSKQIYCQIHFPQKLLGDGSCYSCIVRQKQLEDQKQMIQIYNEILEEDRKLKQENQKNKPDQDDKEEEGKTEKKIQDPAILREARAEQQPQDQTSLNFNDLRQSVIDLGKKITTHLLDIDSKQKSYSQSSSSSIDYYNSMFDSLISMLQMKKNSFMQIHDKKLGQAKQEMKTDRSSIQTISKEYLATYKEYEQLKSNSRKNEQATLPLKGELDKINRDLDTHNLERQNHSDINFLPYFCPKEQLMGRLSEFVNELLRFEWRIKDTFSKTTLPSMHSFQWGTKNLHLLNTQNRHFDTRVVKSSFQIPIYSRSVATEQGRLFLIGGYIPKDHYYLKNAFLYEQKRNTFVGRAAMRYPRASHGILYNRGSIYVFGSFMFGNCCKHCERYDVAGNKWTQVADMNTARAGAAFTVFQNRFILAFGGRNNFDSQQSAIQSIQVYNIKLDQWKYVPFKKQQSMWIPTYLGAASQITEKDILIMGGRAGLKTQQHLLANTYIFDVAQCTFSAGKSLIQPSFFTSQPVCVNRALYLLTNEWKGQRYDIDQRQWKLINVQTPHQLQRENLPPGA